MSALDDLTNILSVVVLQRRYGSVHNADSVRYSVDPATLAAAPANRSALIAAITSQVEDRGRDPVDSRVIARAVDDAITGAGRNASSTTPPVATPEGETS